MQPGQIQSQLSNATPILPQTEQNHLKDSKVPHRGSHSADEMLFTFALGSCHAMPDTRGGIGNALDHVGTSVFVYYTKGGENQHK